MALRARDGAEERRGVSFSLKTGIDACHSREGSAKSEAS